MEKDQEINELTVLGDYWHDQYEAYRQLMERAGREMGRIATRIESLKGDVPEIPGTSLVVAGPEYFERGLILLQGGLSNGSES